MSGATADQGLPGRGLAALPRTAWLRVDTEALAANLHAIRSLAGSTVAVHVVVKADAYGHGAVPVSRVLEAAGADGFCVASFDEAVELRAGGIRGPIVVLYAVPAAHVAEAARRRIALSVADDVLLPRTLAAIADARAAGALRRRVALHLQVETGLGRDGVDLASVAAAAREIRATPGAWLAGVWSHLAAPADRASAGRQAAAFAVAAGRLAAARLGGGHRHLAASGAVLAASVPAHDAVRVGIAMYGIAPDTVAGDPAIRERLDRLRPVASLHALPVRVAAVPPGHGVGYGPSFVAARATRIATLPLGYADGWRRSFEGASVLVRGRRVPTVGRVSMDSVTVDVTDVPGPPVTVDDEFVLLGRQGAEEVGVDELARRSDTIAYEVVSSLGRRLSRVYDSASGTEAIRTLTGEVRR
ncbi:MAG: alanine racemase [Chloroflexi bacterium]|nr:alanine racemase [Chloroflexota bacterium]